MNKEKVKRNNRYNIFVAASVTAYGRTILHRRMLFVGPERILYCDTDSLLFIWEKSKIRIDSKGLGNWSDEYPGEEITFFAAIAPKSYFLQMGEQEAMKLKGVTLTLENKLIMKKEVWKRLIYRALFPSLDPLDNTESVKNFSIFPNTTNPNLPFSLMMTRYNSKLIRAYFSKRKLPELERVDLDFFYQIYKYVRLLPYQ